MSLNPEVSYTYNPAYHIKRGWRLQVIDTSLVTDFAAFRPGLTTTEQPGSAHTGTKVWVYITAGVGGVTEGDAVARKGGSPKYDACIVNPAAVTAAIIGIADHDIAEDESGWIVQKGLVAANVDVNYVQDASVIAVGAAGELTAGADAEVGIGLGIGTDLAIPALRAVYIDCK